jgi:hypothetical protein
LDKRKSRLSITLLYDLVSRGSAKASLDRHLLGVCSAFKAIIPMVQPISVIHIEKEIQITKRRWIQESHQTDLHGQQAMKEPFKH